MVEELKDLQVAPGTRLAKFQLKVKGERERDGGHGAVPCQATVAWSPMTPGLSEDLWRHGAHWAGALHSPLPLWPQATPHLDSTGSKTGSP